MVRTMSGPGSDLNMIFDHFCKTRPEALPMFPFISDPWWRSPGGFEW